MADSASAVLGTASLPPTDALERAAAFTREPFVFEGEDTAAALAPGTPRRRALDAALDELDAGAEVPSVQWRRDWSLLLGLDRVLSQEEPHLVDGTVLSAHQVDALSGTLTALLAEVERLGGTNGGAHATEEEAHQLASAGIPGEAELPDELQEDEGDEEPQDWTDEDPEVSDDDQLGEQPEDSNAGKRFWFEHATGAGKTVAALGFVESSQIGGVLILTHRRNLVDQFHGELKDRGYTKRIAAPLLRGEDSAAGPVTVETYQWFVRNAGNISDAYTIVICDEAHTALGEKTSAAIRAWGGPVFVGMTATGALIARHVTDLFPTQTSRFDLAQAARRGVISPLRCVRIPPGPGVRTIAKVPLRRGEVDVEFDQEMLAELLDQQPFNLAIADLYKTRFDGVPGVVYTAGVRHAHNVAEAFREIGLKARAVSGETPKRELAQILAAYERGDIDVLVNAQLLAEGWNSPRATVCLHLAPTASKRIYQQRVGRVTRRHPGKEAGIVVDFVHPATKHDDPVVTLHSLLDREVYRGGAIVVGPVRRGRGRRLRVERRVVPVTADPDRRIEVFERELWRIAVEHLDWGEQVQWAALGGARVTLTGWRRARAMLHFDAGGELKRTFLVTAVQRNKNAQVRLKALQEIAATRDADAFDAAVEVIGGWPREERREGVKVALQALAEKKLGRRDQANNWIWRCAEYTLDVHEEYAVQRWPETKRLLGLLVNSAAGAHARNARRLVHAARDQDRRLQAALLAAAVPHTAEAGEVINGARARLARKPPSLARELLKNFPKPKAKKSRRRRRKGAGEAGEAAEDATLTTAQGVISFDEDGVTPGAEESGQPAVNAPAAATGDDSPSTGRSSRRRRGRRRGRRGDGAERGEALAAASADAASTTANDDSPGPSGVDDAANNGGPTSEGAKAAHGASQPAEDSAAPKRRRTRRTAAAAEETPDAAPAAAPARRRARTAAPLAGEEATDAEPTPRRRTRAVAAPTAASQPDATVASAEVATEVEAPKKPRRTRKPVAEAAAEAAVEVGQPAKRTRRKAAADPELPAAPAAPASSDAPVPGAPATEPPATSESGSDAPGGADEVTETTAKARRPRKTTAATATATRSRAKRETPTTSDDERETPPTINDGASVSEPSPRPSRRRAAAKAVEETASAATDTDVAAPKPRRSRKAPAAEAPAVGSPVSDAPVSGPSADTAEPTRRKRTAARPAATPEEARAREAAASDVLAAAPRRPRAPRRKPTPTPVELADSVQRASEAAQAAARDAAGDDRATDAAA